MFRYFVALALALAAVALRLVLDDALGKTGVSIFLAAIVAGGWLGGVGPAIFSIVLLHVVHGYAFREPPGMWDTSLPGVVGTVAYYVVGVAIGLLSEMRRAAQGRAQQEHAQAVAERERLHSALVCIADGVLVADAGGRVTLMNAAAEAMVGRRLAECRGLPWREVMALHRGDDPQQPDLPIDRLLAGPAAIHGSSLLATPCGPPIPVAYSAAAVRSPDGHADGAVLVFRDESERLRTEQALRNADRRKDEFLATLAHELRNPLAPLATGLELLKLSASDPAVVEELRAMMDRQVQHMVRLIDDLMDVSRITRGKLELRRSRLELTDVVRQAIEAARPLIDQAQHRLEVRWPQEPLPLYADGNRLTQALVNLLNNAAKYTPPQGRIELSVERSGGEAMVTVSDTGIGIPADKLDAIFDMFSQGHENSESGHTGMGIGLTLVKRLVEMHGGSVQASSPGQNQGAAFRLRLPLLPEAPAAPGGAPNGRCPSPLATRRRVLVVDDNADALITLSRLISLLGGDVRRAHDGLEALEVARAFQPEIVLMDLGMPRLNGYEAARRIREEPWGQGVMLVATSGWGQDADRARTAEAGFDRHLVKPIETSALEEVLHGAGRHGAERLAR